MVAIPQPLNRILPDRPLGRGGVPVSALSLGTAALGLDYGLPDQTDAAQPDAADAAGVIEYALECGVRFFDTAPAYGTAETLLGEVTAGMDDVAIVTKVAVPKDDAGRPLSGRTAEAAMMASLEKSAKRLRRDTFTAVMLHSAFIDDVADGTVLDALAALNRSGVAGLTGASVYDEETALRVLDHGAGRVLQVAYNLLDQRMAARVFPRALETGAGVVVRSAFLKGALSERGQTLPPSMADLARAVEAARDALGVDWGDLASTALRFCLSAPAPVASVLVGARTRAELAVALQSAEQGPLGAGVLARTGVVAVTESHLVNPALWSG